MAVGFDDPITADHPSRNEVEEEEEAAVNAKLLEQYTINPTINVQAPSDATLVILEGYLFSLLAETVLQPSSVVGTICVPELQRVRSPLEEEFGGGGGQHDNVATVYQSLPGSTLIAALRKPLAPEQAVTWAHAVLKALRPTTVIVGTSLLEKDYRGLGSSSDENLVFAVHTGTAMGIPGVEVLPSGTVVSGLAAALLEECETSSIPATALIAVENAPIPEVSLAIRTGEVMCAALGKSKPMEAQHALARALEQAYQSSSSNSMFI